MGFAAHLGVLVALVVNLWLGGDLVEAWAGHAARAVFEIALIVGYVVLIARLGALALPRRRR